MKKSLALALFMVSVTTFAGTVESEIRVRCGSKGNLGESAQSSVFSGEVKVQYNNDEAVSGGMFLSYQKNRAAKADLLALPGGLSVVQDFIEEDEAGNTNVRAISLLTRDGQGADAYLVMNLGAKGSNASLLVNHNAIYSARCVQIK